MCAGLLGAHLLRGAHVGDLESQRVLGQHDEVIRLDITMRHPDFLQPRKALQSPEQNFPKLSLIEKYVLLKGPLQHHLKRADPVFHKNVGAGGRSEPGVVPDQHVVVVGDRVRNAVFPDDGHVADLGPDGLHVLFAPDQDLFHRLQPLLGRVEDPENLVIRGPDDLLDPVVLDPRAALKHL